jgi:hypothetical protein
MTGSLLADDVRLTCHDDQSGRARVTAGVAGLAVATGLLGLIMRDEPNQTACRERAAHARASLSGSLATLTAHTETAIADGVLTQDVETGHGSKAAQR